MLQGKRIVLGITGGIAAYKACMLVSRLKERGAQVRVVMTRSACRFVAPLTLETLSGNPVCLDDAAPAYEIEHIALAKWADAFVVAPATANIIAKAACGIADDLLSSTLLANTSPLLIAPAMNSNMYRNPATQQNLSVLQMRGVRFVGPECGKLACGDADIGRMTEPEGILAAVEALFAEEKRDLVGRRVLVTAGPTRERIDPVRYITNRSTGKMGYAIAKRAHARGAEVVLVSGPTALNAPEGVKRISVESSAQMCENVWREAESADMVIQAAAPADFTPMAASDHKIKKTGDEMTLHLKPTTDIAAGLGKKKRPGQLLCVFAAETDDVLDNAKGKLVRKNADLMVANDVTLPGAGFGTDTNIVTLITREGVTPCECMRKEDVADRILDALLALEGGNQACSPT